MVIDIGKGTLLTLLLPSMALPGIGLDPEISRTWLIYACGGATIVGHCYPVWFRFAGGKGAATAIGVVAVIAPILLVPVAITWTLALVVSGYVGLATMSAASILPVYIAITSLPDQLDLFVFVALLAAFIVFTHRSNIRKMLDGDEEHDFQPRLPGRSR
jgi:glycerol-3-phosphate acyltransferase PlsY